ncbi:monoterpene synthase 8, chloroplastic-like isoform X1 [Carex rostrata]
MALCFALLPFIPVQQKQMRVISHRLCINANLQSAGFERRSGHYQPTIWNDNFIQSFSGNKHEGKNMERVCKLKKDVSQMIYKEELLSDKLELVDTLQRLGVAYHFKDEVNCVLTNIHESMGFAMPDDLYEVSLLFRLLRMHGFSVQEDILKNYFHEKGNCKAKQYSDMKEMISLYEASFLAKKGENALEMARHFTTKHLTIFLESSIVDNSRIQEHVAHALELPLNWRMQRVHTRWFIEQYKMDEQIRPALRELAVWDFNLIQNLYKKELKQVSRWWKDLGLYEKLPFIRDRLVENYIWNVGFAFEPEHSSYRIAMTQASCLITTIDDIYDIYGSLDELEVFTNAIQHWDVTATKGLPENFRMCILALFKTVEDQGNDILKEKGLYVIPHLRQAWKYLCKSYLVEARWYHNGYAPTFQEYLQNAWVSISGHIVLSYAYCMNDYVTAKDLEKFSSGYPDIVRYSSMIFRLHNDLATSTDEIERGDTDKSIQCYMRDKGVTESVARQEIKELILKYWTMLNGEVVGHSAFEKYINNVALNVSRMAHRIFQLGDGYGKPDSDTKDLITSILLEPVN